MPTFWSFESNKILSPYYSAGDKNFHRIFIQRREKRPHYVTAKPKNPFELLLSFEQQRRRWDLNHPHRTRAPLCQCSSCFVGRRGSHRPSEPRPSKSPKEEERGGEFSSHREASADGRTKKTQMKFPLK